MFITVRLFIIPMVSLLVTSSQLYPIDQNYHCESKPSGALNRPLRDWTTYGVGGRWICEKGSLQGIGPHSAMRYTKSLIKNGGLVISIQKTLGSEDSGKGETVLWLRNGAVNNKMKRIRIVIEEQPDNSSVTRIEELSSIGGYQRLAVLRTSQYVGKYRIEFQNSEIIVKKDKESLSAQTSIENSGSIYVHNSSGEGRSSAYGEIRVFSKER